MQNTLSFREKAKGKFFFIKNSRSVPTIADLYWLILIDLHDEVKYEIYFKPVPL